VIPASALCKVDPFVKTGGRAVLRATLLLFFRCVSRFAGKQWICPLNTLKQDFYNQVTDEVACDYKTQNSCLTVSEPLLAMYSHASRLLHSLMPISEAVGSRGR
jgi:hypothetical protein